MYCTIALLIALSYGASKGSAICDALGLCAVESSGAYTDPVMIHTYTEWSINGGCFDIDPIVVHTNTAFDVCMVKCDENPDCIGISYRAESDRCEIKDQACDGVPGTCANKDTGRCFYEQDPGGTARPLLCPSGMHKVSLPTRTDAYYVGTADYGETGPTEYIPGELMDIHIRVLDEQKKFLGILMYAVSNTGEIPVEGCPTPGCDGKNEIKLGTWEGFERNFKPTCGDQAITHSEADVKNYYTKFRWRAPEAGSGDVIFRTLLKQGSTNGGNFHWPMVAGDLMLTEGAATAQSQWFAGSIDQSCAQICSGESRECDSTVEATGTLGFYDEEMKHSTTCLEPLLSSCARGPPTREESTGLCWLENQESGTCSSDVTGTVNICEAVEAAGGDERLCPCGAVIPGETTEAPDDSGDGGQTTEAPNDSGNGGGSDDSESDSGGNGEAGTDKAGDSDSDSDPLMSESMVFAIIGALAVIAACAVTFCSRNPQTSQKGVGGRDVESNYTPVKRQPTLPMTAPNKIVPPPPKRFIPETRSVDLPPCPPPR